jgi:hypothetical protein
MAGEEREGRGRRGRGRGSVVVAAAAVVAVVMVMATGEYLFSIGTKDCMEDRERICSVKIEETNEVRERGRGYPVR